MYGEFKAINSDSSNNFVRAEKKLIEPAMILESDEVSNLAQKEGII